VGREKKKNFHKDSARNNDVIKKANKDERRKVKKYLENGIYDALKNTMKFSNTQIEWDD
jgi:hypothetical protein